MEALKNVIEKVTPGPAKEKVTSGPAKETATSGPAKETATSGPAKATSASPPPQSPPALPAMPSQVLNTNTDTHFVEVDEAIFDTSDDSGLDTAGTDSSTTSVSSSVRDYTYENGRRYHSIRFKEGEYFMPNDEIEQERLDFYHHMFMLMLGGKLYTAPLDNPQRVLDIGTGTGIWAIDFAETNPQAEVIGTDLSPIQPCWVSPNLRFEVDDMEEPWTYKKDSFDYIHLRTMSGCFRNWDVILAQAFNHSRPGGYTEFQDYGVELFFSDGRRATNTPLARFNDAIATASEKSGRILCIAKTIKSRMEAIGFDDVQQRVCIWPVGVWPKDKALKELGRWTKVGLMDGLEAFSMGLLTRHSGWTTAQVEEMCKQTREDLANKSQNKYYYQGWFIYGKRPKGSKQVDLSRFM